MGIILIQFFALVGFLSSAWWLWAITPRVREWCVEMFCYTFTIPKRPRPASVLIEDIPTQGIQAIRAPERVPERVPALAPAPAPAPAPDLTWKDTTLSHAITYAVHSYHARLIEEQAEERIAFPFLDVTTSEAFAVAVA